MSYFHIGAASTAPAWKLARVLLQLLGKALERNPPTVWNGAPPDLAARLIGLSKRLSAPDEDEQEARTAQRLARSVRELREGWRVPEGHFSTVDAAFTEGMAARALEAIERCAAAGASGNESLSLHAFSSAAFCIGAAYAFTGQDADAIVKSAFVEMGRKGGVARHAKSTGKAQAKALWVAMRTQEPKPKNHLIAQEIEKEGHAAYATALKWITEWRKAKPPALK